MADMNVKGGYFAPSNYLKVNEGGSHDENPNGGVQIGVDQNGTPNMLEEGEPVYNDFVYSDNIIADAEFLAKHNLPKKYEGWLYSRIADDLFEEYSATPLDPISKNGADVMLTRLAECQEEQKQVAEQMELEQMIAELSPEEQEALAQMVAQEAQQPSPEELAMAQQQAMPQEQVPVEAMQMYPEQMALPGQMPVMAACGGKINRYDDGGKFWNKAINVPFMHGTATGFAVSPNIYAPGNLVESTVGDEISYAADVLLSLMVPGVLKEGKETWRTAKTINKAQRAVKKAEVGINYTKAKAARDAAKATVKEAENALKVAQGKYAKALTSSSKAKSAAQIEKTAKAVEAAEKGIVDASKAVTTATDAARVASQAATKAWYPYAAQKVGQGIVKGAQAVGSLPKWVLPTVGAVGTAIGVPAYLNYKREHGAIDYGEPIVAGEVPASPMDIQIYTGTQNNPIYDWSSIFEDNYEANGGDINRYDDPLIPGVLQRPRFNAGLRPNMEGFFDTYTNGINNGRYHSLRDSSGRTVSGVGYVEAEPIIEQPTAVASVAPNVSRPAASSSATVTPALTRAVGAELDPFVNRKNIPYIDMSGATAGLVPNYSPLVDNRLQQGVEPQVPSGEGAGEPEGVEGTSYGSNPLSTWPRYAGAVGSELRLLNNVIQPADEYNSAYYHPEQIYNYLPLIDPRFNPIDINRTENSVINQSNATARALMNSGVGGSTPAALIAADAVANANRGAARVQDMQINEQLYNQALSGVNSNAAARSQNDLAVDRYNAQARMDAQYRNIPLNLQLQMLNNQAEAQKYAAIGQEAQNLEYALQRIGRENFAMNQINSNPAFEGYGVSPYGILNYLANISEDGGFIKKIKKAKK